MKEIAEYKITIKLSISGCLGAVSHSSINRHWSSKRWELITNKNKAGIILSMRVCSSKPAILIEFNDVDIDNLAGYKECTCVLYTIQHFLMHV